MNLNLRKVLIKKEIRHRSEIEIEKGRCNIRRKDSGKDRMNESHRGRDKGGDGRESIRK